MTTIESPNKRFDPDGFFLRELEGPEVVDRPDTDTEDETGTSAEKALLCRQCRSVITSDRYVTTVNGDHLHTFFNPAGIIFEICCFTQAKGCAIYGEPTSEFSWFKGFLWRYALCATCQAHLGWIFDSGESTFFGLIKDKLVER